MTLIALFSFVVSCSSGDFVIVAFFEVLNAAFSKCIIGNSKANTSSVDTNNVSPNAVKNS